MTRSDETRALRRMVDEVRAEPVPEVDWERVEAQLLDRIARRDRPRFIVAPPQAPSSLSRAFAYVAVAAGIVLALGSGGGAPQVHRVAEPRIVAVQTLPIVSASSARDVSGLQVGDAVETGDEAATFALVGSVRWTLGPNSRAVVRARATAGVGQVVALERGSIEADVTPRDPSEGFVEAFAVEAGGTRVAVHGTLFRVVREQDQIVVDVEHGTVAVGPTGHVGVTTGRILVGPARASFSLDGGRSARRLDRGQTVAVAPASGDRQHASQGVVAPIADHAGAQPGVDRSAQPSVRPGRVASHDQPAPDASHAAVEEPIAPVAEPVVLTEGGVQSTLVGCIKSASGASASGVVVQVSSKLTLKIRDDGTIQSGRFDPPLKPELQSCAGGIMGGRFSPGARTIVIPVSVGQ